jgi:hypothetical protein
MEACTQARCVQIMVNEKIGDQIDTFAVHVHPDDYPTFPTLLAAARNVYQRITERQADGQ